MNTKTKKPKTAQDRAIELADYYAALFMQKQELEALLKETKEGLQEYAIENPEDFEGKKTLDLGEARLVWKLKTNVKTGSAFNPTEFMKAYPDACDVKLKPSKLINIDLVQWGIEKEEEHTFAVEVK